MMFNFCLKSLFLTILLLFLSSGCSLGRFSVNEGTAKFSIPFDWPKSQKQDLASKSDAAYVGMSKSELYKVFAEFSQKGYRKEGDKEWITFSAKEAGESKDTVTFYLVGSKVKYWEKNNLLR